MNDVVIEKGNVYEVVTEGIPGLRGPAGTPGNGVSVIGETPAGAVNGSNATFTTAFPFTPESVDVTVNGLRQKKIDDFNTSGTQQIILTFSPGTGEKILVNYLKA